jgi:DsbC/DsbD-like thiol-disulfide interchange protein
MSDFSPPLRSLPLLALALGAFVALAPPVMAESLSGEDVVVGDLLGGWQIGKGHQMAGLHLRLAPEWKTYWRAPGDAGIPPRFDWSGSQNLRAVAIHWPQPSVFMTNGLQSLGYTSDVVLPLEITATDPGVPVTVNLTLDIGVCRDICVPATLILTGELGPDPQGNGGREAREVARALKAIPIGGKEAGLGGIGCEIEPIADGLRLTARIDLPSRGSEEVVVFETSMQGVWVAQSMVEREGRQLTATTELVAGSGAPFALDRSGIRITVLGDGPAAEIMGCPAP